MEQGSLGTAMVGGNDGDGRLEEGREDRRDEDRTSRIEIATIFLWAKRASC